MLVEAWPATTVANREELLHELAGLEAGQETEIGVRHADKAQTVKLKLDRLPEALPPPTCRRPIAPSKPGRRTESRRGVVPPRDPEFKNEVWAYVPEAYDAAVPLRPGRLAARRGRAAAQKELLDRWKPLCDRYDLILVGSQAGRRGRLDRSERGGADRSG